MIDLFLMAVVCVVAFYVVTFIVGLVTVTTAVAVTAVQYKVTQTPRRVPRTNDAADKAAVRVLHWILGLLLAAFVVCLICNLC